MIRKEYLIQFDRAGFMLLAFLLPLHKYAVPVLIALLVLRWLLGGRFLAIPSSLRASRTRTMLALFALFYVLHFIGMLGTTNLEAGWFDLEIKLSLLIFPLLFITLHPETWNRRWYNAVFIAFAAGSLLSILICLVRALLIWNSSGDIGAFYYTDLSWFHHPAYMAMYLNFATVICLYFLIEEKGSLSRGWRAACVASIFIYMLSVVLLSSKAGILGMILILFFAMVYLIVRQRMIVQGVLWFLVSITVFYILINVLPYSRSRLERAADTVGSTEKLDTKTRESTGERLLIWKASLTLSGDHFFTGVGTGDVIDELVKVYEEQGITAAADDRLNTHNQFLQTQLSLGIIGALALLLMIILPLAEGLRKDYFLYVLFLLLFGFNILFESMLQAQSGVIFYAFLNAMLYSSTENT